MNSLTTDQIGGFEIPQDAPTPEDVENLWNYKNYTGKYWVDENEASKIQYKVRFSQKFNETFGYYENDKSYFEKYYGEFCLENGIVYKKMSSTSPANPRFSKEEWEIELNDLR